MLPRFLYHGVAAHHARSILRKGLHPGGRDGARLSIKTSHQAIYLGQEMAVFYAVQRQWSQRGAHDKGVLIEVDAGKLTPQLLRPSLFTLTEHPKETPDAQFDAIIEFNPHPVPMLKKVRERRYLAGEWSSATHPELCLRSLEEGGEVLYFDTIPPSAFSRVLFIDDHQGVPNEYAILTDKNERIEGSELYPYLERLFDECGISPQEARNQIK